MLRRTISFAAYLLLCSAAAQAQIQFTVTAVANATTAYLNEGEECTFTFVMADSHITGQTDSNGSYGWLQPGSDQPTLWTSVTGSHISGDWVCPPPNEAFVAITVTPAGLIQMGAGTFPTRPASSLSIDGTPIFMTYFHGTPIGAAIDTSLPEVPDAVDFFSQYCGTWEINDGQGLLVLDYAVQANNIFLTTTSMTISMIPEPAASTAILALAATAVLPLLQRRKRRMRPTDQAD